MSHFRRVCVVARGDEAEVLRGRLLELVPAGIEERESGHSVELSAYVPVEHVERLRAALPEAVVEPVPDGWEEAWRSFHQPASAGGLWLGPPWESPPEPARAVVIDPGRAFGTGSHPTTRLCVELLARAPRGSLLDVGCGSGVLAIAGVRLGFGPVVAVDVDPVAVETTRANATANGVALETRLLDAVEGTLPQADVAVANVLLAPVEAILARLSATEAITSGYLVGERPAHLGWEHVETAALDGWAADRFRRTDRRLPG
ncbi:MAG TPA: 50S ribosomal protein L11 methyltransferase [Gaiella sp.]|nr:50S ribosomal protein L11 methyltransferase [Gaiella sp.]